MPRRSRIDFPGLPQHIVVRGNDRRPIFFRDSDRLFFLERLAESLTTRGCDIHAFVLMSNHVHLLATPRCAGALSRAMQELGRAYVSYVNKVHHRTGGLYEGRFKSSVVETTRYFLACMRYIEMNPVRAGITPHPGAYEWSSHGQNITGEPTGLLTPHQEYLNLGCDAPGRAAAYARLFDAIASNDEVEMFRRGARQGSAVGTELFCQGLAAILRRPVSVSPRGRPPQARALSPFTE